jgi:mRNA-degrading endonuclease RelE of RelBE toxin-antitoxin system
MATYAVRFAAHARELWVSISDRRLKGKLLEVAATLADLPALRGRALSEDLEGYFSLHWSRYRLVYLIDETELTVWIVALGQRAQGKAHDVYATAQKLLRQGLLDPPSE